MKLCWTNGADPDFVTLIRELDEHLRRINGDQQAKYAPYNAMTPQVEAAVFYDGETPVACCALRMHGPEQAEIKRMFVRPAYRRHGLAKRLLAALESRAAERGCRQLVLETNPAMADAVALYQSYGFAEIENFGPYRDLPTLCLGKAVESRKP
ncbi:MAG TPA: GNAT family N-acetyltransferase [Candidatus Limiplasma sp.]|nr:GNAT family N-acetyltransferase [Candidatus Limiplasma sp.]HPS81776.1 GNAT family N-acetyltransferase [Candidatus Limiplasma sp.]